MNDMTTSRELPPAPGGTPIQADALLSVTLAAVEWNVVLGALNELPRRISDPLFTKLMQQLQT